MNDLDDLIRVDEVYDMTEEDTKSQNIQEKLELLTGNIVKHLVKNKTFDMGDVIEVINKWEKEGFRNFDSKLWTKEGLSIALGFISSMEKTEHDLGGFAYKIDKVKKIKGFDDHLLELIQVSPPLNEIFNWNEQIANNNADYIQRFAIVFRIFRIFFNKFSMKMEEAKNYRLNFIELRNKVLDLDEERKKLKAEVEILKEVSEDRDRLVVKLDKQKAELEQLKKELKEAKKSDGRKGKETADKKNEEPQIISPQVVEEKKELTPEEMRAKGIKEGWLIKIEGDKKFYKCLKCGHESVSNRKVEPKVCGRCKSYDWKIPKL